MEERNEMEEETRTPTEGDEIADFSSLPEGVIANILSLTSPPDVCRSSEVSWTFHAAAQSDIVWDRFLPSDWYDLVSRGKTSDLNFDPASSSKKQIFFSLCDKPLLIDDGKKSFSLDKQSGKKCIMLGARDLSVVWGDTSFYWTWEHHPESRFKSEIGSNTILYLASFSPSSSTLLPFNVGVGIRFAEVAVLLEVWWLEIRGRISCRMLSPATTYAAYFVFKMKKRRYYGFNVDPADAMVGSGGTENRSKSICLDPHLDNPRRRRGHVPLAMNHLAENMAGLERPKQRHDGWFEIELGEFQSDSGDDEIEMVVMEVKGNTPKSGLVVQGIEIRPKVSPS